MMSKIAHKKIKVNCILFLENKDSKERSRLLTFYTYSKEEVNKIRIQVPVRTQASLNL